MPILVHLRKECELFLVESDKEILVEIEKLLLMWPLNRTKIEGKSAKKSSDI